MHSTKSNSKKKSKIDIMINLLQEIRNLMSYIKNYNDKLLKLKIKQLEVEEKITSTFFEEDSDENKRKDKVEQ